MKKYKSSVSGSTGFSKMNKFRTACITVKLPHTIKILKTVREKRQIPFRGMTGTLPGDVFVAALEV